MADRKNVEIDARLAAIEASLMVQDSVLIELVKWLSQTPEGDAFRESMSIQLEAEASRFASLPTDEAGRFPQISSALRGMAIELSAPTPSQPEPGAAIPNLRLVKNE